jgi:glycosyltransferase involved in cell wall biosynthesis
MTAALKEPRPVIFILDGSVAVTGAFVSARDMARALGGEADVVLILPDTARIPTAELGDFTAVHRLPIRSLRRSLRAVATYLPHLVRATWLLRARMARHPGAVLLVNDFYLIQGPLLRAMAYKGPILTWVRIDPAAFGRIGQLWLRLSARLSDQLIAVSRHVQGLLPEGTSARLLYDPVSAEYLDPLPLLPEQSASGGRDFIFLGNYIEGKGQDLALEALALLLPDVPQARLRLYGGDMGLARNRDWRRALEAQAQRLGIAHAVTFGDFAADPRAVLIGGFASLNLSRSESFSRTVLEASACGLPVIATRSGGPAEILVDGATGLMIPLGDASACAQAMRELCDDPDRAARMGAAGRIHVLQTFAPDAFSRALKTLIAEVD